MPANSDTSPSVPDETKLPFREITMEQAAKELEAAIPEVRRLIEGIERAKKVTRKTLDLEITI